MVNSTSLKPTNNFNNKRKEELNQPIQLNLLIQDNILILKPHNDLSLEKLRRKKLMIVMMMLCSVKSQRRLSILIIRSCLITLRRINLDKSATKWKNKWKNSKNKHPLKLSLSTAF